MRTRSQSRAVLDELKFEIDFDDASNAWMANKRRLPNGCYQYVCGSELKSGKRCQKRPLLTEEYCVLHVKKNMC